MKENCNIWWKLTPVAALITILTWIAYGIFKHDQDKMIHLQFPLLICYFISNSYLSTFSFWHWKTRYRGRWPLGWAVAFTVWWMFLPTLGYFLTYILKELMGKNPYDKSPETFPKTKPLAQKYDCYRSALFVVGGFFVAWGLVASTTAGIAFWIMISLFKDSISNAVPEKFSAEIGEILLTLSYVFSVLTIITTTAALAAGIGAILLFVSQRLKWRLQEPMGKDI